MERENQLLRLASAKSAHEALQRARKEKDRIRASRKKERAPHGQQNDQVYSDQQLRRLAAAQESHEALMRAQKEKALKKQMEHSTPKKQMDRSTPEKPKTPKVEAISDYEVLSQIDAERAALTNSPFMRVLQGLGPLEGLVHETGRSQKVLQASDTVERALQLLSEQKQSVALPVVEDNRYLGFVSIYTIASFVIASAPESEGLSAADLDSLKIPGRGPLAQVPVKQVLLLQKRDGMGRSYALPSQRVLPAQATIPSALGLFSPLTQRVVLLPQTSKSEPPSVVDVVSRGDVVKAMVDQLDESVLAPIGERALQSYGYGTGYNKDAGIVLTISAQVSVVAAIQKLSAAPPHVTALAVVNPVSGSLMGCFSASDLQGLAQLPQLLEPVEKFLSKNRPSSLIPVTGAATATVMDAVTLMIEKNVEHVWFLDRARRPAGVFSIADFLSIILTSQLPNQPEYNPCEFAFALTKHDLRQFLDWHRAAT
eukprot:g16773.t1